MKKKLYEKWFIDDEHLHPTKIFYDLKKYVAFNVDKLKKEYPNKSALEIIEILASKL